MNYGLIILGSFLSSFVQRDNLYCICKDTDSCSSPVATHFPPPSASTSLVSFSLFIFTVWSERSLYYHSLIIPHGWSRLFASNISNPQLLYVQTRVTGKIHILKLDLEPEIKSNIYLNQGHQDQKSRALTSSFVCIDLSQNIYSFEFNVFRCNTQGLTCMIPNILGLS